MIFDLIRNLNAPSRLIPVEALLDNCDGSRMPDLDAALLTPEIARRVVEACPTSALTTEEAEGRLHLKLDYGDCIGCGRCSEAGGGAVSVARRFGWTGLARNGLARRWDVERRIEVIPTAATAGDTRSESSGLPGGLPAGPAGAQIRSLMGRALNIRQLDPGSCNGCEAEISALTNPYYDLERFGIHFVASPKHADMLLVTGPVTRNMAEAVRNTYEAVPAPRLVVAVGACGVSGGIFARSHAVVGAVDAVIPVDGYIPGCPPTPAMLVAGILETLRRRLAGAPPIRP